MLADVGGFSLGHLLLVFSDLQGNHLNWFRYFAPIKRFRYCYVGTTITSYSVFLFFLFFKQELIRWIVVLMLI